MKKIKWEAEFKSTCGRYRIFHYLGYYTVMVGSDVSLEPVRSLQAAKKSLETWIAEHPESSVC